MQLRTIARSVMLACGLVTTLSTGAVTPTITAVPPATFVPPPAAKAATIARPLIDGPRMTIVLPPPSVAERATLKATNAGAKRVTAKSRPLAIGMGRSIPAAERSIHGPELTWTVLADGTRVARVDVRSSGAAGVRIAITMPPGDPDVMLRFAGAAPEARIFGPYPANRIAEVAAEQGVFWTPVLEGDTGSIEIQAPVSVPLSTISLTLDRVSHLLVAGAALRDIGAKAAPDGIGLAAACEIDIACVSTPSQALYNTARSVAKMVFTGDSGTTFECTGTLVNDSVSSFQPYFFTASHCIDSSTAAATLNTYWFFDAVACNSKATPPYVLLTGGAMLLGRSEDYDWALVRLHDAPPAGAQFSAWRSDLLDNGTVASTLHHPEGDLKKRSQGTMPGYYTFKLDGSSFAQMQWSEGATEAGSSGAGLFTFQANGGYYELRGGLYGGDASCANPAGIDYFSRLDKALPVMRQYLTPDIANPNGEVPVVEFYNRNLDHYFISTNPAEINDLDVGVHPGWERTGFRFLAYSDPARAPANATPVCRFYLRPQFGDSHFYSASPAECAATAQRFGDQWTYESPSVFWIQLPDATTGACPASTRPVYRFFNSPRTNHRYTAEVDVRDTLRAAAGWIAEGYGPDATIMCSPTD